MSETDCQNPAISRGSNAETERTRAFEAVVEQAKRENAQFSQEQIEDMIEEALAWARRGRSTRS